MKGRGLVLVLALILATLATAGVFLYARGVQEDAETGGAMVPVVVSKVDIPARADLNELIKDNRFETIEVPQPAVVGGAVTSIDQLRDKHNSVAILAGEQIPVARITGTVPGGALSIPEGMQAITVSLDAPRAVAGVINNGDHVAVYTTFREVPVAASGTVATAGRRSDKQTVTAVLVPSAEILAVYRPLSGSSPLNDSAQSAEQLPGSVTTTIALTAEDAQHFVFAMETGSVWFGLLPPDASGEPMEPISYAEVLG